MTDLIQCVRSVFESSYTNLEVIVVDNASTDDSLATLERAYSGNSRLKIVRNLVNLGFAAGNNIGVAHARGELVAFLNQDARLERSCVERAVQFMLGNLEIAALQPRILSLDDPRLIDSAGVVLSPIGVSVVIGHGQADGLQYQQKRFITSGLAAALFVRSRLFRMLGGFDEDFFVLAEDGDFCWRVWLSGNKVVYYPKALAFHRGGSSRRKETDYFNYYYSIRNNFTMLLKNLSAPLTLPCVGTSICYHFTRGLILRYQIAYFRALGAAIRWQITNRKAVWRKRENVQSLRKVSDALLISQRVLEVVNPDLILRAM